MYTYTQEWNCWVTCLALVYSVKQFSELTVPTHTIPATYESSSLHVFINTGTTDPFNFRHFCGHEFLIVISTYTTGSPLLSQCFAQVLCHCQGNGFHRKDTRGDTGRNDGGLGRNHAHVHHLSTQLTRSLCQCWNICGGPGWGGG